MEKIQKIKNIDNVSDLDLREILSLVYDYIYEKTRLLLREINPCENQKDKSGCSTCIAVRKKAALKENRCCNGCKYLSKEGCTVKSISCSLYLCHHVNTDLHKDFHKKTEILYLDVRTLKIYEGRWSKEDAMKNQQIRPNKENKNEYTKVLNKYIELINEQVMNEKLLPIIEFAIKNKDFDKLRYIGQSLDVMCFSPEHHKSLLPLFNKVDDFLIKNNIELLGRLNKTDYPDLNKIGIVECKTFTGKIIIIK